MRRDDALRILRQHHQDLAAFGVRSLALFGSTARDEARPESDVDLLVDFAGPARFDSYMDLKLALEEWLGRSVDLITAKALKPQIRPRVEREAVYVA